MKTRVAMIYGGRSGEHEISIKSAQSIIAAMDPAKYEILHYKISQEGKWSPKPISPEPGAQAHIDVVFPILHGTFGEDGTMQGLLELADLPYVGAGVMASAISMDKEMMKRVCRERGLPVVEYVALSRDALDTPIDLPFPVFVKPANLGSSVGISKAHDAGELAAALKVAAQYDRKVLVERGITGREFECSVMGNDDPQASLPCELFPSKDFYDYDDKYILNAARVDLPAKLTPQQTSELRGLAIACYQAVECAGLARVDFLMEAASGKLYINEINTLPGFTSISMFPKMWEHSGIAYPELIDRLIALAQERHAAKKSTKFSR
jgi:D-alanine-D-alanine ligase